MTESPSSSSSLGLQLTDSSNLLRLMLKYGAPATALFTLGYFVSGTRTFCQLQKRLLVLAYEWLGPTMKKKIIPYKKELLQELKDRSDGEGLSILEIGPGQGDNISFYPDGSSVIAVDPNEFFKKHYDTNMSQFPNVKLNKFIDGYAEDLTPEQVPDSSVDVVVSTHVLCSVKDVAKVIGQIERVLKPGGSFYYLEHIEHPSRLGRTGQWILQPLWSLISDGCKLLRDPSTKMTSTGTLVVVREQKVEIASLMYPVKRHLIGVRKKGL